MLLLSRNACPLEYSLYRDQDVPNPVGLSQGCEDLVMCLGLGPRMWEWPRFLAILTYIHRLLGSHVYLFCILIVLIVIVLTVLWFLLLQAAQSHLLRWAAIKIK